MKEEVFNGIPVNKGIAIGILKMSSSKVIGISERQLTFDQIDGEIKRYRMALEKSRLDIQELKGSYEKINNKVITSILDTHLQMLSDPLLVENVENKIREVKKNSETVVESVLTECKQKISCIGNSFFKDRTQDINDVHKRVLGHLLEPQNLPDTFMGNIILCGSEIMPSELIGSDKNIVAIISEKEGVCSHTAIIAKSKGIPYISRVKFSDIHIEHQVVIVDADEGKIIVNPYSNTLEYYLKKQSSVKRSDFEQKSFFATTLDGYNINISANADSSDEINTILEEGGNGVGLFRSEYLLLKSEKIPSEEEQFYIYRDLVQSLKGRPLTIRLFDIGGDKGVISFQERRVVKNKNSSPLGLRGVRLLLASEELLKDQIRAILRASCHGEIHILVPFVSDIHEFLEVKNILASLFFELKRSEPKLSMPNIGCMIELPSVALTVDLIAKEADFLSIGTNDLIQYLMGADRSNPDVAVLYTPYHPSLLRLLKIIVDAAKKSKKTINVCGELASYSNFIPFLVGLGINSFSVAVNSISEIRHKIRSIDLKSATVSTKKALKCKTKEAVQKILG